MSIEDWTPEQLIKKLDSSALHVNSKQSHLTLYFIAARMIEKQQKDINILKELQEERDLERGYK